MSIDIERLDAIRRIIASTVSDVDEIADVLILLARTPDDEWEKIIENGKHHRKMLTVGTCVLCFAEYRTSRNVNVEICDTCCSAYVIEIYRVKTQCYRAKKAGLPDTLTLVEWLLTLAYFQYLCAYCQKCKYQALDHFIPVSIGGGTTADNCVPVCKECNYKKRSLHPDKIKSILRIDIERVREYLSTLKSALQNT